MTATEPDARLTNLFEHHYDEVLAYCTRRIGRSDADDATAEVFAVAWRRIEEIEWASVRPWLYGIARRVLANRWRSITRRSRLVRKVNSLAPTTVDGPDVYVVRRDQDREVAAALKKLKDIDQEVLMLAAWEELSAPEIAATLDISTSAAEQRLHRAKARLAGVLEGDIDPSQVSPRAAEERGGG